MKPNPDLRGKPFRMRRFDVDDQETYEVTAPGWEDWEGLCIVLKPSGYRAYVRETVASYSHAWGHGGHCVHYRWHALRSADTGKPLRPEPTAEAMLESMQRLFWESEAIPA